NQADVTEFAGEVDRDETIAALFVQDEIQLGRWALLLGLRGDRGGQGETALSYRGGVRYDVSDRTTLRAGVARAFRAPTLSDRYLPPTPFGPVTFVGNPDLKPETAISAEIGWLQRIGSGLHLEVTAYAIRSDGFWDFIADTGSLFKAQNITRVPIYGLEATLSARLTSRFDARLGYTYNDAKYSEFIGDPSVEGNYVDDNVLHSGSASLSWAAARGVDFWLSGQFVGRRYTDPENTEAGRLKPYQLVGAGVSVRIAEPITLRLKADNLFDQHYQTRPEFYQAGLTFTVGLQASF
ncbi:MAG TPA: TonB-dependent receptor, partial [Gemmatimonadales bacterium]|nr:TonB-dependent receptor [Gemmatimonadales bacterium]